MLWRTPMRRYWNPWSEMASLQRDVQRMLDGSGPRGHAGGFPNVSISSDTDQAVLAAEIPGVNPESLEVTVRDNTVTIRGERAEDSPKEDGVYIRHERDTGRFVRSFALPFPVESADVSATYQRGVLEVTLPRSRADRPTQITVRAA